VQAPPWARFADAVLLREAALCRTVSGVPPRDDAGLFVGDVEIDALLRTLPGLDGPAADLAARIRGVLDPVIELGRQRLETWLAWGTDPLAAIGRRCGLSLDEAAVLALVAAVEIEPQRQRTVAYVQDSIQLPRITLAGLRRLLGHDAVEAVSPQSTLVRLGVLTVDEAGPWATRMCLLSGRMVWAATGIADLDPALPAGATVRPPVGGEPLGGPEFLLVHGADPESRRATAQLCLPGQSMLCTPVPNGPSEWAALVREAVAGDAALLLEVQMGVDTVAAQWIQRTPELSWVLSSGPELPVETLPERPRQEIAVLDGMADEADWLAWFSVPPPEGVQLSREQLRLVAASSGGDIRRLSAAVRRLAGGHLDHLAVRVRPRRGWADLVLPHHPTAQLHQLVVRHRHKAKVFGQWGFPAIPSDGVVALFAGPSGTGKTLAAEVVAAELGLDLYKVDLSSVVSKYIGETEKNLERIFTAAAAGDLVLFFDEADALFGKRSEVSSSHDRYANIEVAYLSQRLETYDGIVVLATNLQRNIDEAFLRRIGMVVTFAAPDEEQRKRIWELVFPAQAPLEDLDVDFLARQFEVTGGIIRSAALNAAFAAAELECSITMDLVAMSIKQEFAKLGRLSTENEFERYYDVVRSGK